MFSLFCLFINITFGFVCIWEVQSRTGDGPRWWYGVSKLKSQSGGKGVQPDLVLWKVVIHWSRKPRDYLLEWYGICPQCLGAFFKGKGNIILFGSLPYVLWVSICFLILGWKVWLNLEVTLCKLERTWWTHIKGPSCPNAPRDPFDIQRTSTRRYCFSLWHCNWITK